MKDFLHIRRSMRRSGRRVGFVLGGLMIAWAGWGAGPLYAQDSLATDAERILPEIMPREVEILGEFEAQFPSFQRRALTGFNPPPRIYEVPRDRMPYTGPYRQSAADLPPADLAEPIGPTIAIRDPGTPTRGQLSVGFGRLLGREVDLRFTPRLGARTAAYAGGRYAGWSDYKPFKDQEPDLETSSQGGQGEVGIKTVQRGFSAGAEVDGYFDRYGLFGARPFGSEEDVLRVPLRNAVGVGGDAWIRNAAGSDLPFHLRVGYDATRYETEVFADARPDPGGRRAEKRLDVEGGFGGKFSSATLALDGKVTAAGLDTDQQIARDHVALDVGTTLRLEVGRLTRLRVGARFLGYDVLIGEGDDKESALYLSPALELDFFARPGLQVFLRNRPGVEVHGLRDLLFTNPYVVPEPVHKPTVTTINAETGLAWFQGVVRVSGHVGFERHPHYLYFVRTESLPVTGSIGGLFEPAFDQADILRVGGEIGLAFPGGVSTAVEIAYRDGSLGDGDQTSIPYFASLVGSLQITASFADRKGLVSLTANAEGPRPVDRVESATLDGYLTGTFEVSYLFGGSLGLFGKVDRLTERRFAVWENYPLPVWLAIGGVRVLW